MRDVGFEGFFLPGRSRKAALRREIEVTPETIRSLLARGVNRRDDNGEPIRDLGWNVALWSGRVDAEAFSLSIHCGCYSKCVGNNLALTLPPFGPHSLENAGVQAERLFDTLISVWQPEQAILCHVDELRWKAGRIPADVTAFRRYG